MPSDFGSVEEDFTDTLGSDEEDFPDTPLSAMAPKAVDETAANRRRTVTTALVNISGVMERMDEQILPAVYAFVGTSFHATPAQLGVLTLGRALVQALSSPAGGLLGHYCNRITVIAAGCCIWGTCTALFGLASSLQHGIFIWAVNGVGLAMVIPSGQSLIADYYDSSSRGKAFGALYLTGALGGMSGSLYATNLGARQWAGIPGWRLVFFSVAVVSILIGVVTLMFGHDPNYKGGKRLQKQDEGDDMALSFKEETWNLLRCPTFLVIVVQGIVGTTPWTALVFLTLYLQLIGMSDFAASSLAALFLGGTALGSLLGGYLGDEAAVRWPNHGRIFVVQFSVSVGPVGSLMLLKGMPLNGETATVIAYALLLFFFGLLKSWSAPACNNPVFAEIVPASFRNMIFAFDRCFEGAIASLAAPLVGLAAQHWFGFDGEATRSLDIDRNLRKARALGNALLLFLVVPWCLCFVFYSGLHLTYPRDRQRIARAEAVRRGIFPTMGSAHDPELQRLWSSPDSERAVVRRRGADK